MCRTRTLVLTGTQSRKPSCQRGARAGCLSGTSLAVRNIYGGLLCVDLGVFSLEVSGSARRKALRRRGPPLHDGDPTVSTPLFAVDYFVLWFLLRGSLPWGSVAGGCMHAAVVRRARVTDGIGAEKCSPPGFVPGRARGEPCRTWPRKQRQVCARQVQDRFTGLSLICT